MAATQRQPDFGNLFGIETTPNSKSGYNNAPATDTTDGRLIRAVVDYDRLVADLRNEVVTLASRIDQQAKTIKDNHDANLSLIESAIYQGNSNKKQSHYHSKRFHLFKRFWKTARGGKQPMSTSSTINNMVAVAQRSMEGSQNQELDDRLLEIDNKLETIKTLLALDKSLAKNLNAKQKGNDELRKKIIASLSTRSAGLRLLSTKKRLSKEEKKETEYEIIERLDRILKFEFRAVSDRLRGEMLNSELEED